MIRPVGAMTYTALWHPYIECAPDFWLPFYLKAEGPAPGVEPEGDYVVRATLVADFEELTYEIFTVELSGETAGGKLARPIDTLKYRSLRLLEIKSGIGEQAGRHTEELPEGSREMFLHPRLVDDEEQHEKLVAVAQQYVKGGFSGRKPQRDVSDTLGMPIATAGRWIRRAKDRGYIPEWAEPGPPTIALPESTDELKKWLNDRGLHDSQGRW